ncbi:mitochondrial import inner membrane translocase subunit tim21 [Pichia californica]|uniref:Mitochondrial import inner membrane translocase subunit Tim21 n=1 Tax=Pichia californica TaxID=460514 RepID=A0A9P6WIX1_9ASCO|nr:mitochondrial import inner membrane translocase subunit tim21 [[Candida] californica]KAG0687659.1 mitochondrial import inner membrane translocase subunit tim21 [[Candida] californica]
MIRPIFKLSNNFKPNFVNNFRYYPLTNESSNIYLKSNLLRSIRQYSSIPEDNNKSAKLTAQERANRIIYHIKAGSKLVLSSWLIIIAAGATLVTTYLVATEIFSPSGETSTFNRVVNLIEKDSNCLRLLGYSDSEIEQGGIRLKAYGGMSPDLWTRNIPVQATKFTGKDKKEHMTMRFFVESNTTVAVVNLEAIEENFIEQELVFVSIDVKGQNRHYLIGGPHLSYSQKNLNLFNSNGFLGVKWGSKKD